MRNQPHYEYSSTRYQIVALNQYQSNRPRRARAKLFDPERQKEEGG